MANGNESNPEKRVDYASYLLVDLPSDFFKKRKLVKSYSEKEIIFKNKNDEWCHRGLLKGVEGDEYRVEWADVRTERRGETETLQFPIRDLTALLVKVF